MKAKVDPGRCHGNFVCVEIAPEVFKMNREGLAEVYTAEIPTDLQGKVKEAAEKCPRQAISIE